MIDCNVGGKVLVAKCECQENPFEFVDGEWWCDIYPGGNFCHRCGAELRADGTSVTRVNLPDAGEPVITDDPSRVIRRREAVWLGQTCEVRLVQPFGPTSALHPRLCVAIMDETGLGGNTQIELVSFILAAERKRLEWEAEKEEPQNDEN